MTDLLWMPTYVKQWLTSEKVGAMSIAQEGAFARLLVLAWDNPACTVPADRDTLKRLAKWNGQSDADFDAVFSCFQPHPKLPGRLYNEFQMAVWGKAKSLQEAKSKAGRKGGVKRALNAGQALLKRKSTKKRKEQNSKVQEKEKKKEAAPQVDFVADLKGKKAYEGIDIDRELEKAQTWCLANRRICNQRFFVNWLNRIEKPIRTAGGTAPARSLVELGTRK